MEVCFIPFRLISSDTHESYNIQEVRNPVDPFMNARVPQKAMEWPTDGQSLYNNETVAHMEVRINLLREGGPFIQNNATFYRTGLAEHVNTRELGNTLLNCMVRFHFEVISLQSEPN